MFSSPSQVQVQCPEEENNDNNDGILKMKEVFFKQAHPGNTWTFSNTGLL